MPKPNAYKAAVSWRQEEMDSGPSPTQSPTRDEPTEIHISGWNSLTQILGYRAESTPLRSPETVGVVLRVTVSCGDRLLGSVEIVGDDRSDAQRRADVLVTRMIQHDIVEQCGHTLSLVPR